GNNTRRISLFYPFTIYQKTTMIPYLNEITDPSTHQISRWTYNRLIEWGIPHQWAASANFITLLIAVVILVYVLQYAVRSILKTILQRVAASSKLLFFRYLLKNRFA